MSTKLEINIRSLISHCEEMANDNNKDWRLKKYIKSLDTMILEFQEDELVVFNHSLENSSIYLFFLEIPTQVLLRNTKIVVLD